jgi:ParB/RepB/Spo0J family partition protein
VTLVRSIPVADIVPSDRDLRETAVHLDELTASIQAYGLLQPVVVRPHAGQYMLIAGHRRFAAVQRLGWSVVPAIVRDEPPTQAHVLSIVENLQRANLRPREEAAALEALLRERAWSTRQVAAAIHRSASYVSRRLRVFDDPVLAPLVLNNELAVSSAEELLTLPPVHKRALAQRAVDEAWEHATVRREVARVHEAASADTRGLSGEVRHLRQRLHSVWPHQLSDAQRRDLRLLFEDLAALARTPADAHRGVIPDVPIVLAAAPAPRGGRNGIQPPRPRQAS